MAHLFEPFVLRGVELRNRIGVSPMCQYWAVDGRANDWHLVHLGSRAVGGPGLVLTEATAVEARGRISAADLGIWSEDHIEPLARIARFVAAQGAVPGIQLAHAGRKASTAPPPERESAVADADGGWQPVAPSAVPFAEGYRKPRELTVAELAQVAQAYAAAAERALRAGFRWVELHFAHGYLNHSFHSPLSNRRTDDYGGSFEHRVRFSLETVRAVRAVWPDELPLAVRLSCTDWVEGGWTLAESIDLATLLKGEGVDLIDCSSGGAVPGVDIPLEPGYQVPFAEAVRRGAGIATAAVGLLTSAAQAEEVVQRAQADLVFLARELLRDPYWPLRAAPALGADNAALVPAQYGRAF